MFPEVVQIDGNLELVQNSGVQFVDYDVLVSWKDKDNLSTINTIENGYFIRYTGNKDEPLVRLVPKVSDEVVYLDPLNDRVVDTMDATLTVSLRQSLDLYDGVWFPLPYLQEHINEERYGPINWVRARIIKVTDPLAIAEYYRAHNLTPPVMPSAEQSVDSRALVNAQPCYYRVVLAFDTATPPYDESLSYLAPTERDVESGIRFRLAYTGDKSHPFLKSQHGGLPWVREWAEAVFRDLYQERIRPKLLNDQLQEMIVQDRLHEAHYLNLLAFVGYMVNPRPVHFIANTLSRPGAPVAAEVVNVSLILDIGNSRSCGIMVEDHPNVTRSDDNFSDTYVLALRDLNAPEHIYNEPFASRIEFARPNFDYDNRSARSGRPDAFNWPSMVRVGPEANNLAAHREGNEGSSGLTSPKRYLWNTDPLVNDRWIFNNYSYQIKSKKLYHMHKEQIQRAYLNSIGCFFNTNGKAYFALDDDNNVWDNLESCYSNNATMTFMLIEIILQAMVQMNSVAQRSLCTSKNAPRRLKAIILTTPPGMPAEERELYRSCVYEAIGILWKALSFDIGSPREFNFGSSDLTTAIGAAAATAKSSASMRQSSTLASLTSGDVSAAASFGAISGGASDSAGASDSFSGAGASSGFGRSGAYDGASGESTLLMPVPEVYMDWNEAEAGQVVYIYNESQKNFQGNCQSFIKNLRRLGMGPRLAENLKDADGAPLYSGRIASLDIGGGTTDLVIKDYSFKANVPAFAADIIPHEIYKDGFKIAGDDILHDLIKECLMTRLALVLAQYRINFKPVLQELSGEVGSGNVRTEMLRAQFTQQVLVKIAYKLMFHLENLDPYVPTCEIKGTVRDFLLDQEVNESLPSTIKRPGPYALPTIEVLNFANGIMGKYLPNFSILDFSLSFDIAKINRAIMRGSKFNICRILSKMAEVLTTYNCDLLLLTGRSSKIPAIRSFFLQRLNMPAARIVPMHTYRCDSWYPFQHEGDFIGDPKTTAAVGALLSYLRLSHDKFPNFRYNSYPEKVSNSAHYVGIIDNGNMIGDNEVLYKYESSRLLAQKNASLADDEESNFVPYKRSDDAFHTQLSVELGYRLLDDPSVEATPLFKIESFTDVNDIKKVKKARSLTYQSLDEAEVARVLGELDAEVQGEFAEKIRAAQDHLNNLETELSNYQQVLEQNLWAQVSAEVEATTTQPSGLKGLFANKDKIAQEKYERSQALYNERYEASVSQIYAAYEQEQRELSEDALAALLNEALSRNIAVLQERYTRGFAQLSRLLNIERAQFEVTLHTVNRHSPYPVPFIKRNLPYLKPVESFELQSVMAADGRDYTPYFRMYLKTISGAKVKYFMDSGAIDLNGLNPRFVL